MSENTEKKLQIEGRVCHTSELATGTTSNGKQWQKASFVIEYQDQDKIVPVGFNCWGVSAAIVPRLNVGDWVSVSFKPESRTHEQKIYTELKAYYIHIHFGKKAPFEEAYQDAMKQKTESHES